MPKLSAFIQPVREPLKGFTIWFGILSLLLTLHSDIFEQDAHPAIAMMAEPLARLFSPRPSPIDLSSLLNPRPSDPADNLPSYTPLVEPSLTASPPAPPHPIYVFALDASK